MKNFIILFCFAFFFSAGLDSSAQSLSFSRVKVITNVEDTVPVGKVWKIEAILTTYLYQYTSGTSCLSDDDSREIMLNGSSKIIQGNGTGTGVTSISTGGHSLPFWLPAGFRLKTTCANTSLSIIEFTVVP